MNTIEMRNTAANAGVFGAIGYGIVEALKNGATALGSSKMTYFAKDVLPIGDVLSLNAMHLGGVSALFVIIDAVARKLINHVNGRETNPPVLELARVTGTIALTGAISAALGITATAAAASGFIVVSMAVYALVQRLVEAFNYGAYSLPQLQVAEAKA